MRVTAQEEYGLRCLVQLAREPSGFCTIQDIALRETLTTAYVAKLLRVLRKAGLVKSTRGQRGGYQLSRAPDEIDLDTVLTALGGHLYEDDFCERHPGDGRACRHEADCSIRSVWRSLDFLIREALKKTRLSDLVCTERASGTWARTNFKTTAVN